jgi:hypothetical protein
MYNPDISCRGIAKTRFEMACSEGHARAARAGVHAVILRCSPVFGEPRRMILVMRSSPAKPSPFEAFAALRHLRVSAMRSSRGDGAPDARIIPSMGHFPFPWKRFMVPRSFGIDEDQ